MNFPGNFSYIGSVDSDELRRLALALTDEQWNEFSVRQARYEVHRHTQTIGLVYDPDFRHSHPTKLPTLQVFEPALRPALKKVADHFEESAKGRKLIEQYGLGYFIRATLVKLKAGRGIAAHQDLNFSLTHSHRVHLPLITNDDVIFTVGNEAQNLPEGELVEINNRRMHSVDNRGSSDRVHLILDFVLRGEQCCCGMKRHPDTHCSPQACIDTDRQRIPCNCYPEN
ncbi:MAG: aspartyl/asparaginyl beta-hydroxylase domain-containing protein [Woeseiaceae bacterium]|nr:aspartyl/asparaginyl beta-hydroxylase domain-containing protein [Woeseiaceae bacterium]